MHKWTYFEQIVKCFKIRQNLKTQNKTVVKLVK